MTERQASYRVRAHNASTESENRIHSDDVARQYGFSGGLVPGVTVYAYMTRPVVELLGRDWLERGTISARFVKPFYEGEEVSVEAVATDASDGVVTVELTAVRPDGEVGGTGTATLPPVPFPGPDPSEYPEVPMSADRPPADEDSLALGTVLGTVASGFHADRAGEYLDLVADDLELYRSGSVAHPGWLLQHSNLALSLNAKLGPWIHVSSEVTNFRAVVDGDRVAARARVADRYERKGHRFVELDVLYVVDGRPVEHVHHTAIYEPRSP